MKNKKKKMLKEGISLIVLVITIIVMIILATAIILSLNNTNVIQKANEAVEGTNLKNVEESANVAYLDLSYENGGDTSGITERNIKDKMVENGFPEDEIDNYTITTSETGIEVVKAGETAASIDPSDLVFEITTTTNNQQLVMPFIPDQMMLEVSLPNDYSGAYNNNFTLDYGDGTDIDTINTLSDFIQHTYATPGKYTVKVTGTCRSLILDSLEIGTITPITKIVQWGDTKLLVVGINNANISSLPVPNTEDGLENLIAFQIVNCSNLTTIPSGLFSNSGSLNYVTFRNCGITSVPSGLFDQCTNLLRVTDLFRGCTSLTSIPSGLFDQCTKLENIECIFQDCTSLTTIPSDLFNNCAASLKDVTRAYYGCSNLTGNVPDFWNTDKFTRTHEFNGNYLSYCHTNCFYGLDSSKITNYSSIPDIAEPYNSWK